MGTCELILEPGVISKERKVPENIQKPDYYLIRNSPSPTIGNIEIKNAEQIQGMRDSCKLAANILAQCSSILQVKSSNQ